MVFFRRLLDLLREVHFFFNELSWGVGVAAVNRFSSTLAELVARTEESSTDGAVAVTEDDLMAVPFVAETVAATAGVEDTVEFDKLLTARLEAATVAGTTGREATATPVELVVAEWASPSSTRMSTVSS